MHAGSSRTRALGILIPGLLVACGGGGGGGGNPPPPTPTATLSIAPASATVMAGSDVTTTATIVRGGGFTGAVTIGATSVPAGVTVTGGAIAAGSTTLVVTVATEATAAVGTMNLSVTGTATGVTIAPAAFALTIQPGKDSDGDGQPDAVDADDDNDGVLDVNDLFPLDPARSIAIQPAFPKSGGLYQLPLEYPSVQQLDWVLAQLAAGSTSVADINAHFTTQALASTSATQWQNFFQSLRTASPNAIVVDLIAATPISIAARIGTPGQPATGFRLDLTTTYAGGRINALAAGAVALDARPQLAADQVLTLAQAADKVLALWPQSSVLVAEIVDTQCVPILERNATTPRATASVFKTWVLGALAQAVRDGVVAPDLTVPLVAAERVRNALLFPEPLGTPVPLPHMAVMMMGDSDNSATDHLHELVGRTRLEAILAQFDNQHPQLLTPLLSVNEVFTLLFDVPLAEAQAYAVGTEEFQRNYLDTVLVPHGPSTGSGQNLAVHTTASWQASPLDVCNAHAGLRRLHDQSPAFQLADRALSSNVGLPLVRDRWERVWNKGGSLGEAIGLTILTQSWLLESDGRGAFFVAVMVNKPETGIDATQFRSLGSRILQLVDEAN